MARATSPPAQSSVAMFVDLWLRRILKLSELIFPTLFDVLQYHWHISLKRGLVYPDVAPCLFKIMKSKEKVAIDVGANYGIATRYFNHFFRETHAIEPVFFLAQRLRRIKSGRVKCHHVALGDSEATIRIRVPVDSHGSLIHALSTASGDNELTMFQHAGIVEFDVPQQTLSGLCQTIDGTIGFIKIDVEGFELSVLRGAESVIRRDRPILQIEIERAHNPAYRAVVAFMRELDYAIYVITPQGLFDDADAALAAQPTTQALKEHQSILHQYDFLFIPREQRRAYQAAMRKGRRGPSRAAAADQQSP
jgi:FkbM family methyltransferase